MSSCGVMLDTNVFNHLLDGEFTLRQVQKYCRNIYITHIQEDELRATKDLARKQDLLTTLKTVNPKKIATESAVWGVSQWGQAKWGTAGYCAKIKQALDAVEKKSNNIHDALIGEVAIINGHTLITNDRNLLEIISKLGGKAEDLRV